MLYHIAISSRSCGCPNDILCVQLLNVGVASIKWLPATNPFKFIEPIDVKLVLVKMEKLICVN